MSGFVQTADDTFPKTIWILWLQGWDNAPWLIREIADTWIKNNPDWTVVKVDAESVRDHLDDISYIDDPAKQISPQAMSDILRLSLLNAHGGIWVDATMLCLQPLTNWAEAAVAPAGLWMYHGHGGNMSGLDGSASWFIMSEKGGTMIRKWKVACDRYWAERDTAHHYFWMDSLFRNLHDTDPEFRTLWSHAPHLYCGDIGQAHGLFELAWCNVDSRNESFRRILRDRPPYALKLNWKRKLLHEPDLSDHASLNSNTYFALQVAKEGRVVPHVMGDKSDPALQRRMRYVGARRFVRRKVNYVYSQAMRAPNLWRKIKRFFRPLQGG